MRLHRVWACGCEVVIWIGSEDGPEEFPCDEAAQIIAEEQSLWSFFDVTGDKHIADDAEAMHRRLQNHRAANCVEEEIR